MKKRIIFLIGLLLAGCSPLNNNEDNQGNHLQNLGTAEQDQRLNDEQRADYLAELASSVRGVKNATAVVAGEYAIIGIDVDQALDRPEVGTIKYAVAESVKHDPMGKGAIVVADPDMNARLGEIRQDMADGRPLQGILNELADITGRLIPELPAPEQNINPQEAPDKARDEVQKNDRHQLQKKQKEESTE